MLKKYVDPIFKERFHLLTSIRYLFNVVIEPSYQKSYEKAWKNFLKKKKTRAPRWLFFRFNAFLKRIEKLKDDLSYCKRIKIVYINKQVGYGVFAKTYIPPYSILHHYAGIIKPDKKISSKSDSAFMFSDFPSYSIDASQAGNWTRFMNHGKEKGKHTNVVAWEHYSRWGPRIIFTASWKGVKKGEQLLYSYGEKYWEEDFIEF